MSPNGLMVTVSVIRLAFSRNGSVVTSALSIVEGEVRELVRRRSLDPVIESDATRRLVNDVVQDYQDRALMSQLPSLGDPVAAARAVFDNVAGFGVLQQYFDDPTVEEIWINEPGRVFVARRGRSELTTTVLTSEQVATLVEQMLRISGRRLDLSTPFVDAQLPDGSRLHVVIPSITRQHLAVNSWSSSRDGPAAVESLAWSRTQALPFSEIPLSGSRRYGVAGAPAVRRSGRGQPSGRTARRGTHSPAPPPGATPRGMGIVI